MKLNTVIGFVIGCLLCFVLLASWSYFDYQSSLAAKQHFNNQQATQEKSMAKTNQPIPALVTKPVLKSANKIAEQKLSLHYRKPLSEKYQAPLIYQSKDHKGNLTISNQAPAGGDYKVKRLNQENISIVDMPRKKVVKHKKAPRPTASKQVFTGKQALLLQNKTSHCRWLVGRNSDLREKILRHRASFKSNHCAEYNANLLEMKKLAKQGRACRFPYKSLSKCH